MVVRFSPKILGLNAENFETISGSPGKCSRIGFDPETNVFMFCFVFWCLGLFTAYNKDSVMNGTKMVHCREGLRGALFSRSEI